MGEGSRAGRVPQLEPERLHHNFTTLQPKSADMDQLLVFNCNADIPGVDLG